MSEALICMSVGETRGIECSRVHDLFGVVCINYLHYMDLWIISLGQHRAANSVSDIRYNMTA